MAMPISVYISLRTLRLQSARCLQRIFANVLHALNFQEQAAVLPPDPLITVVQPAVVNVRVRMEIPGTEPEEPADEPSR